MNRTKNRICRRGIVSMLAIVFLALTAVLAVSIASLSLTNAQIGGNQNNMSLANAYADSGMRWMAYKLYSIQMPTTTVGIINGTTAANTVWPAIINTIQTDVAAMTTPTPAFQKTPATGTPTNMHIGPVYGPDGITFEVWAGPSPDYPAYPQVIQVKSVGTCGSTKQAITMNFLIQKSMRYGVLSKIPIQLGKNTVVEGDVYMGGSAPGGTTPPILSISDFRYTSATTSDALTNQVQTFQNYLKANYSGSDNRVSAANLSAIQGFNDATYGKVLKNVTDANGDGYIDEYDLFLGYFGSSKGSSGANGWGVSQSLYNAAAPKDPNLFLLIDKLASPVPGAVAGTPDATQRAGFGDSYCDGLDPYFKIKGTVRIWETQAALTTRLSSASTGNNTIEDVMQGPIISRDGSTPVVYGVNKTDDPSVKVLDPANFNTSDFLALSGTNAASGTDTTVDPTNPSNPDAAQKYANTSVSAAVTVNGSTYTVSGDANGTLDATVIANLTKNLASGTTETPHYTSKTINGQSKNVLTSVTENVPYGSTDSTRRSTVNRPVFSNINFRNCIISRGTNALFVNCTFDGVTFVDGNYSMTQNTSDYPKGNNLRFESCTFTGPIAQGETSTGSNKGKAPASYTDYTNSWEFTGATTFDLRATADGGIGSKDHTPDSAALAAIKEQATIMASQTNIEMGSFTAPGQATCSFQGVVVAGCFDVRGTAIIDGSIVVPSSGAGNVTLGYFGANDNTTNQGQPDPSMVSGSYGRIYIRFNPYRTLPNGINLAVSVYPDLTSWKVVAAQ